MCGKRFGISRGLGPVVTSSKGSNFMGTCNPAEFAKCRGFLGFCTCRGWLLVLIFTHKGELESRGQLLSWLLTGKALTFVNKPENGEPSREPVCVCVGGCWGEGAVLTFSFLGSDASDFEAAHPEPYLLLGLVPYVTSDCSLSAPSPGSSSSSFHCPGTCSHWKWTTSQPRC